MTQSLSNIVSVTVEVSPVAAAQSTLNLGLIVGTSTVISAATRTKVYSSTDDMKAQGWAGTEPEYAAAAIYFAQTPRPTNVVIGRQDATVPETAVQAVTACRTSNSNWYAVYVCDTVAADIEALAAYIETATPLSVYFYETADSAVLNGTAGNVMATLQADKYHRTWGQYSTTAHAAAAAMGYAMGANTGLANSAFTLAYKSEVSVTPETLTTTQVQTITGYNGNVYTNYGAQYNLLVQGTMADGTPFDQVLNLDTISNNIQTAVVNALTQSPKIPQTDSGVSILVNDIAAVCQNARTQGVLAPGVWNAAPVLGLATGSALSNGYLVLADKIANQSQADRTARKSPPIYACLKMAGAIEHVVIGVVVNQ